MRAFGGHSCRDRTAEFKALAERLAREGGASTSGAQENGGIHPPGSTAHKSEFISRAKRISAGIAATAEKLQRLSQLAKRTSMFDDPAVEINELTSLIKQDIQGLNGALTDLSTFQSRQANGNRQVASLSTNTVDDLRARLKDTTASFRDVLMLRQENLKVHQGRRQLFSAAPESRPFPAAAQPGPPNLLSRPAGSGVLHGRPAAPLFGSSSVRGSLQGGTGAGGGGGTAGGGRDDVEAGATSEQCAPAPPPPALGPAPGRPPWQEPALRHRGAWRAPQHPPAAAARGGLRQASEAAQPRHEAEAEAGAHRGLGGSAGRARRQPLLGGGAQQQQLALLAPQESYQSSRAVALQSVERTIHELGAIFQDLALMVHQQGGMALRIEDDVEGMLEIVNSKTPEGSMPMHLRSRGAQVQQQGEMALRIEDNVDGTLENVNQAQAQLLKYLNTISSNRWLILKVFMVLMAFLVLFLVFIA